MTFVEVSPGDVFVIEPGTPHAIGKGVLLLEPQRVSPGKRGVTYRYWDWNRRYDSEGRPDPAGAPRQLHVERALEVTRWEGATGASLVRRIHLAAGAARVEQAAVLETLLSPSGPLDSETFVLRRASGTGALALPADDGLRALTVLQGRVVLGENENRLVVEQGQTVALPASSQPVSAELEGAHAMLCGLA
jgi:mannose-6-phosphate isomerase